MGGWSRDLGVVTPDEVTGVAKVMTAGLAMAGHTPAEIATVAKAVAMAKAGIEAMGGEAHVWMGGQARLSSREDPSLFDETVGGHQPAQTSITVTISLVEPLQPAPVVEAPIKVVGDIS